MQINEGDGFRLTNGRRVRVGSIFDIYESYETDEQVGHEPTTHVRYSHWWNDGRIVAGRTKTLDEFLDKVEERVPQDELPEKQSPTKSRS